MGGAVSAGIDHDDLVDKLKEAEYIKSDDVEAVFRAVDRGFYFLPDSTDSAYRDLAWKRGNIHLSAPCIYGEVMESLKLEPGLSFLNLGSGTGYLSTMAGLILGPYGINHGVELYDDVIEYAKSKLIEFIGSSPALDCYDLCEPHFVKGNSLCLNGNSRLYDRVYCGASCPENHEDYMKNLLKIGGVLVMPLNDQLMQITRTSDCSWESNAVLSVSFASLQLPSSDNCNKTVNLPEVNPLELQDICRNFIRSFLREQAKVEFPDIAIRKRKIYSNDAKKKLQNVIIPFGSAEEEILAPWIRDRSDGEYSLYIHNNRPDTVRRRCSIFRITDRSGRRRLELDQNRNAWRRGRTHSDTPHIIENGNNTTNNSSDSADNNLEANDDYSRPVTRSCSATISINEGYFSEQMEGNEEDVEEDEEEEEEEGEVLEEEEEEEDEEDLSERRRKLPKREKLDSGIGTDNTAEGSSGSDSDRSRSTPELMDVDSHPPQRSTMRQLLRNMHQPPPPETVRELDVPVYSDVMRQKVNALPLPQFLKDYLNFFRSF